MGKITINQASIKSAREWKRHKVNEGSNVFRILPPFGELSTHNNYPYRKWSLVWAIDPKTNSSRPFASPKTDGEDCPVDQFQSKLSKFIEQKRESLLEKGLSKDSNEFKDAMKTLLEVQWKLKVGHIYLYNACDKAGNVGLLELKSTAHKEMKKMMNTYIQEYNQDPTSLGADLDDDAGVWFNIAKEGSGKTTEYSVTYHQTMEKINGRSVKVDDRSPLAESVVQNYHSELGYDLSTVYKKRTFEEMDEVLKYNIKLYAEDCPDLLSIIEDDMDIPFAPDPAPKKAAPAPVAKKPIINLSSDDDDDEEVVKPKAAAPTSKKSSLDINELKNLADLVLGD